MLIFPWISEIRGQFSWGLQIRIIGIEGITTARNELCIPVAFYYIRCLHFCWRDVIYKFFNCSSAFCFASSLTLGFFNVALYPPATIHQHAYSDVIPLPGFLPSWLLDPPEFWLCDPELWAELPSRTSRECSLDSSEVFGLLRFALWPPAWRLLDIDWFEDGFEWICLRFLWTVNWNGTEKGFCF
jgi:hypothetical protein